MILLTQGSAQTTLACQSCDSTALRITHKKVRPVLGRAVWILEATCHSCMAASNWKWMRSVFLDEVESPDPG